MKIILSRKGFDSQYGGVPSPIFEDGSMVSLPIPSSKGRPLSSVSFHAGSMSTLVSDLTSDRYDADTLVHLDPDLRPESAPREKGWRPSFGQVDSAQSHLLRQGVGVGDVFLFFGWFRRAEKHGKRWRFVAGAPDIHSLFGWLQVGAVLPVSSGRSERLPQWLHDHPHVVFAGSMNANNTIYVGAESLMGLKRPGAGVFTQWSEHLQLTADGQSRSIWKLPPWMNPEVGHCALSYHTDPKRWRLLGSVTYLRSVAKGQEFVMDVGDMPEARRWLRSLTQ